MSVKVKLKEPISVGSETINELEIRKPKAKDLRSFPANLKTGDILDLCARLSGHPPSVIDELSVEDMNAVVHVVSDFLSPGPETGKSS